MTSYIACRACSGRGTVDDRTCPDCGGERCFAMAYTGGALTPTRIPPSGITHHPRPTPTVTASPVVRRRWWNRRAPGPTDPAE